MTKEQQNRFLILFALANLESIASKSEVLDFLIKNDLIILTDNDIEILATRKEEKWKNELVFVRTHLVKDGYLSNSGKDKWEVSSKGMNYFNSLVMELDKINYERINIKSLEKFDFTNVFLINDEREIIEINRHPMLTKTEKENIILSRIGQGTFRRGLIKLQNYCALSKCSLTKLLVASHIKPWKYSDNFERLDKFNGLLLLPTYDKLFDLGYITFESSGKILISSVVKKGLYLLGLNGSEIIQLHEQSQKYMEYHRKNVFMA